MRTKSHIVCVHEEKAKSIDVFTLDSWDIDGKVMQTGPNSDFVFSQVGGDIKVFDLAQTPTKAKVAQFAVGKECVVEVARENEAKVTKHSESHLSVQCPTSSSIISGDGVQLYKSESSQAEVARLFAKIGSKTFIRMMKDLQLQYVSDGHLVWKREEALS
jgi:hypothetical protein